MIVGLKEILNYNYRKLYFKNKAILASIPDLLKSGNFYDILNKIRDIKFVRPQLDEKVYWSGVAKFYLYDYKEALNDLNSVEDSYSNFAGFLYHKGLVLKETGDYKLALNYFSKSIDLEKNWQNYDQIAVMYMELGDLDSAESDLHKSMEICTDNSNTCNYAILLNKRTKYDEAIEFFNKSIELNDKSSNSYYNRALTRHLISDYALVINDFDKAEELGRVDKNLYLNRGICKCENGDLVNGLIDLKKAQNLDAQEANELIEKYEKQ